jgi:hypothetical protein
LVHLVRLLQDLRALGVELISFSEGRTRLHSRAGEGRAAKRPSQGQKTRKVPRGRGCSQDCGPSRPGALLARNHSRNGRLARGRPSGRSVACPKSYHSSASGCGSASESSFSGENGHAMSVSGLPFRPSYRCFRVRFDMSAGEYA